MKANQVIIPVDGKPSRQLLRASVLILLISAAGFFFGIDYIAAMAFLVAVVFVVLWLMYVTK